MIGNTESSDSNTKDQSIQFLSLIQVWVTETEAFLQLLPPHPPIIPSVWCLIKLLTKLMSNRRHIHCQLCNSPFLKLGHFAAAAARCCIDTEVQRLTDFTVGDVATVWKTPKQDLAMFLLLVLTSPAIPELMFQANSTGCFHYGGGATQ